MSKRDIFIEQMDRLIGEGLKLDEEAMAYYESLKSLKETAKPKFTENGKLVLQYMKDNYSNVDNLFKSKDMGEGMGISSRTVAGALRKLVTDGYVAKVSLNPTVYEITEMGIAADFNAE